MAICSNHCVLLHRFLSSRPDAVDHSNWYCVRNLVRCWNRINQPFGLVGKWAKTRFPCDCRHDPYLRRSSCYKYFFKIFSTLVFLRESRISCTVRWFLRLKVPSSTSFNLYPLYALRQSTRSVNDLVKTQICCGCGVPGDDPHHLVGYGFGGQTQKQGTST